MLRYYFVCNQIPFPQDYKGRDVQPFIFLISMQSYFSDVFRLLPFSSMTLVPQLNPTTLCQAVHLLMASVPTWSSYLPVAKGVAVMASGALSVACVNQGL